MRKLLSLLILIPLIIVNPACKLQKRQIKKSVPVSDNGMISLDWNGTYQGILPCADCPGIKIQLILNKNMTYKVQTNYLERGTGINTEGKFSWNEEGNIITLDSNYPQNFLVGENRLFQLDGNGNRITGDLANRFILEKEKTELTGKNWKLIMLNEEPVKSTTKQPFMVFHMEEKSVNGNTGCNNFFGTYELINPNGIKFSPLGMTKMACIGDNYEQEFIEIMENVTNYDLSENELILLDKNNNILAKFEADFFLQ